MISGHCTMTHPMVKSSLNPRSFATPSAMCSPASTSVVETMIKPAKPIVIAVAVTQIFQTVRVSFVS